MSDFAEKQRGFSQSLFGPGIAGPVISALEPALLAHAADDELADFALLPAMGRPRQQVIGVEPMERQDETPGEERYIEPRRTRGRAVDEEESEIDADEDGEVSLERAHGTNASPRPLLDLGDPRLLAYIDAGSQLDRLA